MTKTVGWYKYIAAFTALSGSSTHEVPELVRVGGGRAAAGPSVDGGEVSGVAIRPYISI